jgi:DNA repair protein RecN (Recombination protein N)
MPPMLTSLEVRDILILRDLRLDFHAGLTVLTGETGAGKSILLDALGLVLGWKGRADVVRQGAAEGEAVAVFALPPDHAARAVLAEAGLPGGEDLILRRTVTADGRRTAYVNDRRVGAETLRALADTLVELHGQHDDRGLLNPRGHRALLDAFAGHDLGPLRAAWAARGAAARARAEAEARLAAAQAEEDFLRHAVAELDKLSPEPGEEAALDARRRAMQAAARVTGDVARALEALGEEGAEARMRDARRWLEGAAARAGEIGLDPALAALDRALIELSDAQAGVERALTALDHDPSDLERVEERLFALRALARKHGTAPDDLGAHAAALRDRLAALDGGARDLAGLRKAETAAAEAYAAEAARASALRRAAALRLDSAMAAELPPLKLDRARFATVLAPGEAGPEGTDAVTFTVATNPGAPAGALDRIASGGELSRFLLALKVCLAGDNPGLTLIFDEIDRGVGGATAAAVGRRLRALAGTAQVLVVTHSPQVAAMGAQHLRVEKSDGPDSTETRVEPLPRPARIEEIARMLAGDTVTAEARAAAAALLAG